METGDSNTGLSGGKREELLGNLQQSSEKLKKAGDELKKSECPEAESAGKISHECRSLLNVVIGFTELMLDETIGKINDEQRSSLTEVLSSARRLLQLINVSPAPPVKESGRKK